MKNISKVCDAADWFDPEVQNIIINELREPSRFHRKQWEFAMIFLALQKLHLLNDSATGLSLGGGNERVLYSIANHIKKLFVTDLYDDKTIWDCARTNNPDDFISKSKPFDVNSSKIKALRMDMRNLDFEENTFDFCYSSCAIEHIGSYQDFVQHFNEVYRCLKDGGYYIFTTEFHFGNETIETPNNYIFSPDYLERIIFESNLSLVNHPDARLTHNKINYPIPANFLNLIFDRENTFEKKLMDEWPHLILLRGKYPFTSILFITQKQYEKKSAERIQYDGIKETVSFLKEGVSHYQNLIENSMLSINPFSVLPNEVSRFYLDHCQYFENSDIKTDDTLFHSDYYWLGKGTKKLKVSFNVLETKKNELNRIQFRIHRFSTLLPQSIECIFENEITISDSQNIFEKLIINADDNYNYAVLAKIISGSCIIDNLKITCEPEATKNNPIKK